MKMFTAVKAGGSGLASGLCFHRLVSGANVEMSKKRCPLGLALLPVVFFMTFVTCHPVRAQAHFQSQTSGSWSSASTWLRISGTDGDGIPDANDTVDVITNHTVSVAGTSVNCATILVQGNATLSIAGTGNVQINANPGSATIYGTVTMSSSGRLTETGTGTRSLVIGSGGKLTISGSAANPSFDTYSFDPGSTYEYTASANQNVLAGVTFGNLTLGGSAIKTVTPVPPDTVFRCAGKLSVASGTSFDVSTNILRIYFNGDVENYGTIDASIGITVLWMTGAHWINNGSYLPSTTPGFGYTPTTTFINTEIGGTPVAQTFHDLVIEGTTTALNNLIVGRHLTVAPGATFNGGTGVMHEVKGNWTNNGVFDCGTCTVTLNGTAAQTVGASAFYNLVVNNALGVTLTGNVSTAAGGTLTLTSGNIATGAFTMAVNSTDPAALTLGSNKIVGTVSRAIAPGSTGTYKFFTDNTFVVPGGTGNPTVITATVYPNTNPPGLGAGADTSTIVKRYYTFTGSGTGGGFTYTLRLPYEQSEVRGVEGAYSLWRKGTATWINQGSSGSPDTVNNYVQQSGLTSFSDWMIGSQRIVLNLKVVLQGPFSGGTMTTALNSQGVIPLAQPYNGTPWFYGGTESVATIPSSVVDWVLLEVRAGDPLSPPMETVASRAAFLKSDGTVVDTSGTGVVGASAIAGNYYVVVRHRNHLAIMSATAAALNKASVLYDFTTAQSQAYSTNPGVIDPMIALGTGGVAPFGMFAGDANSDGFVNAADRTATRLGANQSGYRKDDVTLDGFTNAADRTRTRLNANKSSMVP